MCHLLPWFSHLSQHIISSYQNLSSRLSVIELETSEIRTTLLKYPVTIQLHLCLLKISPICPKSCFLRSNDCNALKRIILLIFICYSCYAVLCYAMLCYAMLCYAMLSYAMLILCYLMLCYAMLCYDMLCCAMVWYDMLCYAMIWYAMLCYAMLCYDMLCYAMLCYDMICYAVLWYDMICYAMICYNKTCYAMLSNRIDIWRGHGTVCYGISS